VTVASVVGTVAAALAEFGTKDAEGFERYRNDPCSFFREQLALETWDRQEDLLRAVAAHDWVSVRSGHRVSKTYSAGGLALWFIATRGPGARCILTGPSFTQMREALWRSCRAIHSRARGKLGGDAAILPSTGIRWPDERQIVGITADTVESFQGLAAPEIMFIVDEASGVEERIFEAILSNLAGGGRLLLLSNPVRSTGFFFESQKGARFERLHISSAESPNVTEADPRKHIKGLATRAWLADCARMWGGEEGMLYKIRCLGEFVEAREGRMFPPAMLERAELIWSETEARGRLVIGLDPAGEGGDGDASGFVCRRGLKVPYADVRRGLTPEAHLVEVLGLIGQHKGDSHDTPWVVVDRDGLVGHRVWVVLNSYAQSHEGTIRVIGIRGSEHAKRRPLEIDAVRDEMWFALVDAFTEGLAIPTNTTLSGDLAAIRFDKLVNGRAKVIRKNAIRRELGRSPDLGDALALCCYQGMDRAEQPAQPEEHDEPANDRGNPFERPHGDDDYWQDGLTDPRNPANGGRGWGRFDDDD
jgi:hypothetical protein